MNKNYLIGIFALLFLVSTLSVSAILTNFTQDSGQLANNSGFYNGYEGNKFKTNSAMVIYGVNASSPWCNNITLWDATGVTLLATASCGGSAFNYSRKDFASSVNLTANTVYQVKISNGTHYSTTPIPSFPIVNSYLNWTGGVFDTNTDFAFFYGIRALFIAITMPGIGGISFQGQTPAHNAIQYYTNNSFILNTTVADMGLSVNTTFNLYYSNRTLYLNSTNTTINSTHLFSSIPLGTYYYNATATNGTYTNTTETRNITIYNITTGTIIIPTSGQNVTRFLNITWTNSTTTNNVVNINNYTINLLNNDSSFNQTLNVTSMNNYYWDTYINNLSIGAKYVRVLSTDTGGNQINSTSILFNITANSELNVTAFNGSIMLSGFTINTTGLNDSSFFSVVANAVNVSQFNLIKGRSYLVFADALGFAYSNITFAPNLSSQAYQFNLLTSNSVNVSIFDDTTFALVTQNVTVTFSLTGAPIVYTYVTTSGNVFAQGLTPGNYTVTIVSPSPVPYTIKTYSLTVPNRSTQSLTAFLNTGTAVLFNARATGGSAIQNADIKFLKIINSSWVVVEEHFTDITGRAQFTFTPNVRYAVNVTKSGYVPVYFELNPVLFTSYDIPMSVLTSGSAVPTAIATFSPNNYRANHNTNFSIIFFSPYSSFVSYDFNLSYPSGSYVGSGNNNFTETFSQNFTITGSSIDRVTLFYEWTLSNGAYQNFTYSYPLVVPLSNRTISNLGDTSYGFLIGDKVVILGIIMLVIMGVAWLAGGFFTSLVVGGIFYMLFLNTGFILPNEQPIFYASAVIIVLLLVFRGRQ